MSEQRIHQLIEQLHASDKTQNEESMRELVSIGEPAVKPLLSNLSTSSQDIERIATVLRNIGRPAIQPLVDLYHKNITSIQLDVVYILTKFPYEKAIFTLTEALEDDDEIVRSAATNALSGIPEEKIIFSLVKALSDEHEIVRAHAVHALRPYASKTIEPYLLKAIQDPSPKVRQEAIWTINESNSDSEKIREALTKALEDENDAIRQLASAALREIEGDEMAMEQYTALEKVASAEADKIIDMVRHATENPDEKHFETIGLLHSNANVRARLLQKLPDIETAYAVKVMIPGLNDINPAVRVTALEELEKMGTKAIDPLIMIIQDHDSKYVRGGAAEALGVIGKGNEQAFDALVRALHDLEEKVQIKAIEALGNLGDERAVEYLRADFPKPSGLIEAHIEASIAKLGGDPNSNSFVKQFFKKVFG